MALEVPPPGMQLLTLTGHNQNPLLLWHGRLMARVSPLVVTIALYVFGIALPATVVVRLSGGTPMPVVSLSWAPDSISLVSGR